MIGHGVPVYQGYASQYGHGLGNVLRGYMRRAIPILKPWMKSTGKRGRGKRAPLKQKPKHKRRVPPGKK